MVSRSATPQVLVLFTSRCEKKDVPNNAAAAEDIRRDVEAWRDQAFPDRGASFIYRSVPTPRMWIFHAAGGYRGIVWHQRDTSRTPSMEAVWICAFGYEPHRGETGPNVYDWAADLDKSDPSRLMPQRADFGRYEAAVAKASAAASVQAAKEFRREADAAPDVVSRRPVLGIDCELTSHGDGIYSLRVPYEVGEMHVRGILALTFTENVFELVRSDAPEVATDKRRWRTWTLGIDLD